MRSSANPVADPSYQAGALALVGSVVVLGIALGFEYLGGYTPCPLCLQQRYAYYLAIPALFIGLVLTANGQMTAAGLVFLFVSLAFLINAGLGFYHAGAEWKFWPGPDTCAVANARPPAASGADFLKRLQTATVVRCDEAPWRFLGLSFAGWNVVTSMLLWITAQRAAFATTDIRRSA